MAIKKKKVLYIEDDPTQAMLYEIEFQNNGFNFLHGESGQMGLDLAKKEKPDLILLDLLLNDIGGLQILEKLKADSVTKDIKVIVFSNFQKKGLEEECEQRGAIDFWEKSKFVPKEIVEKVKKIL